jgi:hypothetical protein
MQRNANPLRIGSRAMLEQLVRRHNKPRRRTFSLRRHVARQLHRLLLLQRSELTQTLVLRPNENGSVLPFQAAHREVLTHHILEMIDE